jgi:ATP-binding cassette subfamily B protein
MSGKAEFQSTIGDKSVSRGDYWVIKRLAAYLLPQKQLVTFSLTLTLLLTGIQLLQPYLIKVAIDTHIKTGDIRGLQVIGLTYLGLLLVESFLTYYHVYVTQLTGQRVMRVLRGEVFGHTQRLSLSYFDRTPVGRVMTRVTSDVETLNEFLSRGLVTIISDVILLVGILVVMLSIDAKLTLVSFVAVPPLVVAIYFLRNRLRVLYDRVRTKVAQINAFLQESISGMEVIQAFVQERENEERFGLLNRGHLDASLRSVVFASILSAVIELASVFSIALVIWYGGGGILAGTVTLGVLTAFIDYLRRFYRPIEDLSDSYDVVIRSVVSARRIFDHLDTDVDIREPESPRGLGNGFEKVVEFDRVDFAYYPDEPVLKEVTLDVKRGEKVAVVGATGAGKSTLVKLLCRFYDVTGGAIRIDGLDIREMPVRSLRSLVGIVLQDVFLFSETVGANIDLSEEPVLERVGAAARAVQADGFIERLPENYSTRLGERGASLSFGERQLLAFARALALDPPILVLDEATSSVDSRTEARIQEALKVLLRDRTALIIAHRLSTIREADRIIVLHKGQVREEGTHRSLLRRGGIYTHLYKLQFETGPESEK